MEMSERLEVAIRNSSKEIYDRLQQVKDHPKGNYLDISTKGTISYLPANRIEGVSDYYGELSKRVAGKPVKILKSFLGEDVLPEPWLTLDTFDASFDNLDSEATMTYVSRSRLRQSLTDRDWELFNYAFTSYTQDLSEFNFVIVKGADIRRLYLRDNYTKKMHMPTLHNSCMNKPETQQYLDAYVETEACSLLVQLDDEGMVMGRALVWTTDDNITFMDRVYGDESTVPLFRRYAAEHGWHYRTVNSFDQPDRISKPTGEEERKELRVSLPFHFRFFPYMDTFQVLGAESNERGSEKYYLANRHQNRTVRTLTSTRG